VACLGRIRPEWLVQTLDTAPLKSVVRLGLLQRVAGLRWSVPQTLHKLRRRSRRHHCLAVSTKLRYALARRRRRAGRRSSAIRSATKCFSGREACGGVKHRGPAC
jgi:hypothetical protein